MGGHRQRRWEKVTETEMLVFVAVVVGFGVVPLTVAICLKIYGETRLLLGVALALILVCIVLILWAVFISAEARGNYAFLSLLVMFCGGFTAGLERFFRAGKKE